ncbi:helix-turn-helix domain-containing protein [Nocardioides stalactiti]|uniref:helix-turn-helix domain-containing protein n=1 Tax=Nocardioides stalactiti TaxID=2755356 RepID=UPI001C81D406|nr:helix-turn-helix transcriptional regulator [Nocardioides stalactiti]
MTDQYFDTDLPLLDTDRAADEAAETETDEVDVDQVEVRRNVVLSAVVGALAGILTGAFALRAFGGGGPLDWAAFAVLGAITVLHLAAVADGRAPLLVADRLGVRLREGATWQGIAWDDIECLEHLPRRMPLHDGHLLVVGDSGQQLIVPLTLATRIVGAAPGSVSDELAHLADGRADVVEVVAGLDEDEATYDGPSDHDPSDATDEVSVEVPSDAYVDDVPPLDEETVRIERRGIAAEVEKRFRYGPPSQSPADSRDLVDAGPPFAPGRPVMSAARVEMTADGSGSTTTHPTLGANALQVETVVEDQEDALVDLQEDRSEHTLTVVLDDVAVRPAPQPVIGPQLEAARSRLRLTVDQLSERTRIRPHVIEALEVDDFGPCGGDFYARGHLRTLARVLGIEAGPLVAAYDETYADAPVDPRRVFESELATGVGGSIRGTRGGRNWSVLLAAVMAAVLVWSIARLVMDGPVPIDPPQSLKQMGSDGLHRGAAAGTEVPVVLNAPAGGAQLVVRDSNGDIKFKGQLAFGQTAKLKVVPPVRIWSSDGSVTAAVDCKDPTALGETGIEVNKTLPGC